MFNGSQRRIKTTSDANQTDESDLMPYEDIREIERAFLVRSKKIVSKFIFESVIYLQT